MALNAISVDQMICICCALCRHSKELFFVSERNGNMELYSMRTGALESSKHASQRMTHDPSLQVCIFAPHCSTHISDCTDACVGQGSRYWCHESAACLSTHGCPVQDRPIQAEDGRIIFASTHVPNKQPRHGWTAIYSSMDGRLWSILLSCISLQMLWCRKTFTNPGLQHTPLLQPICGS